MGTMIKTHENKTHRGMKGKVISRESQLLRSVLVHVASAFTCALVCSYSYWFPWLSCLTNHFVWIYLPTVWSVVFGPKYMFLVANVIVLVVIGDWRQTCAKSKTTHQDMYDEYVQRSRRPRRVMAYKKVGKKAGETVKKIYGKAHEIKIMEMVEEEIVEKKEEIAEEFHESKEDIVMTEDTNSEEIAEMIKEASESNTEEKQEEVILQFDDQSNNSAEEISEASHDRDDENIKKGKETRQAENGDIKKVEQTRSNDDELNKRVEDFIARVNKRRWAEANNWLICSA